MTDTTQAPVVPTLAEMTAEANANTPQSDRSLYVLVVGEPADDQVAACMMAEAAAKRLGTRVQVFRSTCNWMGLPFREYEPRQRAKRGDATHVPATPRGADWSSKSGQAVTLMLRPEGATMDEMSAVTGWTFGAKYVRQLERSFHVTVAVHDATARTKRTWHADTVTLYGENNDSVENVIDFAAAMNLVSVVDLLAAD